MCNKCAIKYPTVLTGESVSDRILKIGQHLIKLRSRCLFLTYSVQDTAGCGIKKVTPRLVGSFLSNSREFQGEILHTYLLIMYLHAGINSI